MQIKRSLLTKYIRFESNETLKFIIYVPEVHPSLAAFASTWSHFYLVHQGFVPCFLSVLARDQPFGSILGLLFQTWIAWWTTNKRHATKVHHRDVFIWTTLMTEGRDNKIFSGNQGALFVRFPLFFLLLSTIKSLLKTLAASILCSGNCDKVRNKEFIRFAVNDP